MDVPADLLAAKAALRAQYLRPVAARAAVRVGFETDIRVAVATAHANVHAVGIGRKIVAGVRTETRAVRLYVTQKIAPSLLPPADRIPERIDGVPTDVIESPAAFLMHPPAAAGPECTGRRQLRQRPLMAGVSAAHEGVTVGTVSCFCRSTRPGDESEAVFVLGNNHVFADVDQAFAGDPILQPGPVDGGAQEDAVATLHRYVPLALGGAVANTVDAAIARLLPEVEFRSEICGIGTVDAVGSAEEELRVRKHGRTTGYTEGEVTDALYDAVIGMDHNDPSVVALFTNQLRIEARPPYPAFALGGDSGSLVVHGTRNEAVGLSFAGPPGGSYGVANPIAGVLSELEIALL
ncbi:MAG TPA: hypothetical protein VHG91_12990 [Longimicrobium sp.]|nr:hypothetical protein [Longimicrobium sp.]